MAPPSFVGPTNNARPAAAAPGNSFTGGIPGTQFPQVRAAAAQPGIQHPLALNAMRPGVQYPRAQAAFANPGPVLNAAMTPGVQYPRINAGLQGPNGDQYRNMLARAIQGGLV